jgi:hypothetical protein
MRVSSLLSSQMSADASSNVNPLREGADNELSGRVPPIVTWRSRNTTSAAAAGGVSSKQGSSSLTFYERLQFFNVWKIVTSFGNLCNMTHTILEVFNHTRSDNSEGVSDWITTYCFSCSSLILWVSLLQFAAASRRHFLLVDIVHLVIGKFLRLLLIVFPVFCTCVILTTALFGAHVYRFSSLQETCITLFAFMNGDSIRETWTTVREPITYTLFFEIAKYSNLFSFLLSFINIVIDSREYDSTAPRNACFLYLVYCYVHIPNTSFRTGHVSNYRKDLSLSLCICI